MAQTCVPSFLPKQRLTRVEENPQVGRRALVSDFYTVCLSVPILQEHSFNKMSVYFPVPPEE